MNFPLYLLLAIGCGISSPVFFISLITLLTAFNGRFNLQLFNSQEHLLYLVMVLDIADVA